MHLVEAFIHGGIWSLVWTLSIIILTVKYPGAVIKNYPLSIQEEAKCPDYNVKNHRTLSYISIFVIMGYYLFAVLFSFRGEKANYFYVVLFTFIMFFVWNLFDLLVLDFLLCGLEFKYLVLPGTKGNKGYKDFYYHFKQFGKGMIYVLIGSIVVGSLAWVLLL